MLNYLKATGKGVGLVLNFGREAEIKRRVHSLGFREGKSRGSNADSAD